MAKRAAKSGQFTVVRKEIDPGKPRSIRYRIARRDGKVVKLRVIDVDAPDFTAELTDAFRKSVRKAREENRAIAREL